MDFRSIQISDRSAWLEALTATPHQVFHLPDCIEAIHGASGQEIFLMHGTRGDVASNVPLVVRHFAGKQDVTTPYGYGGLTASPGLTASDLMSLEQSLAARGFVCGYISLCPFANISANASRENLFANAPTVYLDLGAGLGEVERKMSSMRRRNVRLRSNLTIDRSKSSANCKTFVRHYTETMDRNGAASFYRFSEETLRKLVAMEESELFVLSDEESPRSSALFARTPFAADYLLGGSDEKGRQLSSATLWAAVGYYESTGAQMVNLGGGMTPDDSLEAFKISFGGARLPFQAFKWVLDEVAYRQLCTEADVPGDVGAGFFPAYHRGSKTARE